MLVIRAPEFLFQSFYSAVWGVNPVIPEVPCSSDMAWLIGKSCPFQTYSFKFGKAIPCRVSDLLGSNLKYNGLPKKSVRNASKYQLYWDAIELKVLGFVLILCIRTSSPKNPCQNEKVNRYSSIIILTIS